MFLLFLALPVFLATYEYIADFNEFPKYITIGHYILMLRDYAGILFENIGRAFAYVSSFISYIRNIYNFLIDILYLIKDFVVDVFNLIYEYFIRILDLIYDYFIRILDLINSFIKIHIVGIFNKLIEGFHVAMEIAFSWTKIISGYFGAIRDYNYSPMTIIGSFIIFIVVVISINLYVIKNAKKSKQAVENQKED